MNDFDNKYGYVTAKGDNYIEIDSVKYPTTSPCSYTRVALAAPSIGDRLEFNFNKFTKEIIFMKNKDRKSAHYTTGSWGYVEDPRDPDECHDMEAVYGNSFEGM
jgi:hypothetical protein